MQCEPSGFKVVDELNEFVVSFAGKSEADGEEFQPPFYPIIPEIFFGTTLLGRGTAVIGGRKWPPHRIEDANNLGAVRDENNLIAKVYLPKESRTSEVDILKKAREFGEKITFNENHITEVICQKDPILDGSSTSTIHRFLGLSTDGSHCLHAIAFRRLVLPRELGGKEMLLAYLHCFFCEPNPPGSLDCFFYIFSLQVISAYGRKGLDITASALRT